MVSEMAFILRLAAALDRRPIPVVESIDIDSSATEIVFKLYPENGQNLSLEKWSMMNCSPILKDICGLEMEVSFKKN